MGSSGAAFGGAAAAPRPAARRSAFSWLGLGLGLGLRLGLRLRLGLGLGLGLGCLLVVAHDGDLKGRQGGVTVGEGTLEERTQRRRQHLLGSV